MVHPSTSPEVRLAFPDWEMSKLERYLHSALISYQAERNADGAYLVRRLPNSLSLEGVSNDTALIPGCEEDLMLINMLVVS